MIKWLEKFKYKTVIVQDITVNWTDEGTKSEAVIIYQENGFGTRRLKKEGCLFPSNHESHPLWLKHAIPWREGVLYEQENRDNVVPLRVVK